MTEMLLRGPIPGAVRRQAQADIADLIVRLHKAAESLAGKLVGLQSDDIKAQRRYLAAYWRFYEADHFGSSELLAIEAQLRGLSVDELAATYQRRGNRLINKKRKWREQVAAAQAAFARSHNETADERPPTFWELTGRDLYADQRAPPKARRSRKDGRRHRSGLRVFDGGAS